MSDQTSLAYIRRTYGVPAKKDARVRFTAFGKSREATIVGAHNGTLRVRFDDRPELILGLHPTWEVVYL